MKDYNKLYYTINTVWSKYINLNEIKKFENIEYSNEVIFCFDFIWSIIKTKNIDLFLSKNYIISAINICLRYYQLIKKLYPYNLVRVIIIIDDRYVNLEAFKSIIDMIPNFAVCSKKQNLSFINEKQYKQIWYTTKINYKNRFNSQYWDSYNGKLIVKGE